MAGKAFTRGQTQVLFRHLPEAIFQHDDYGQCKVTDVALREVDVNKDALFDVVADALATWGSSGYAKKFPDPRDRTLRTSYVVGAPREVRFTPFPQTFTCRGCTRTARFTDLIRRGAANSGRCAVCNKVMNRLPYVQAHNCGRMEELFLPSKGCPLGHSPEHLAFYDPGRVKQARWYCKMCNSDIQPLRMTPCKCAYNDSLPPGHADRYLRIVPTGDPSLYIPHTVAFINFPEDTEGHYRDVKDSLGLMLARMWGVLPKTVTTVFRERRSSEGADKDEIAELIETLRAVNPTHPKVLEYDAKKGRAAGDDELDRVRALLAEAPVNLGVAPKRWLIEHVTLLDKTRLSTIPDVAAMLRRRGDEAGALDIEDAQNKAQDVMGIGSVRVVHDFPLALAAFGYTRTSRDPSRTIISPFPQDDNGKMPVFALSSETEALWFQLDPRKVGVWMVANGLASGSAPTSEAEAWAWVYAQVPGLRDSPHEPGYHSRDAVAVRTLLHTMSHVFLRRIEWSGFSPSSVGEYLIPGSLSFLLYANRYAETKIGGLTTLFEQRLNTWLWDAVQAGHECVYDPICADDGGSCAGCTYREHNCVMFNRELSRSTLYGGPTPHHSEFGGLALTQGYWSQAWQVTPTA